MEESSQALLEDASKAANIILEHVERGERIWVESHLDADGIAAASIIGKALYRLESNFRIRIERWFDEKIIDELASQNPGLIIFTDMGSGYLDVLEKKLFGRDLIILDHHQPVTEKISESFQHVNPHLRGIDGSRDLSGAGVTYLVAKKLAESNIDLAYLSVIGALGDIQDKYEQRSLGGVNKLIVDDAVSTGRLRIETDLLFFGRETRPIHKALAYSTNPFIPGISGQEDKSLALITGLNIKIKNEEKWRALRDLSQDEKKRLFSALADILASKGFKSDVAMKLIGTVYTLKREEPWTPLRDAREFALLLNATGRMGKPSLGVAICMGDRGMMLEQANTALEEYRRNIMKYLNWLNENPERIEELDSVYVVHGENAIDEKMISAISTILSTSLPKPEKPVIGYSAIPDERIIKVSARASELLIREGLNLGEIIRVATDKNMGRGGGHDIAAGGQIPYERKKEFLRMVNELVRESLERKRLGGRDRSRI
ncbi:MAG: DHHA1 domain-containing protein [Candidatus Bathyarchaeia archaeon]